MGLTIRLSFVAILVSILGAVFIWTGLWQVAEAANHIPSTCDQARDSKWRVSDPVISSSGYVSHSFHDIYGGYYESQGRGGPYIKGFLVRDSGKTWREKRWVAGSWLRINVGDAVRVCVAQPAPDWAGYGYWYVLSPSKRR